jgi:hypothetical protein
MSKLEYEINDIAKLCYVQGSCAYFTTQDLAKQWGDDWNDAPYEHNCGEPYTGDEWEIVEVSFAGCKLEEPDEWHTNSPYSVQDINKRAVPWLQSGKYGTRDKEDNPVQIWAGITLEDFTKTIQRIGGDVFIKVNLPKGQ